MNLNIRDIVEGFLQNHKPNFKLCFKPISSLVLRPTQGSQTQGRQTEGRQTEGRQTQGR